MIRPFTRTERFLESVPFAFPGQLRHVGRCRSAARAQRVRPQRAGKRVIASATRAPRSCGSPTIVNRRCAGLAGGSGPTPLGGVTALDRVGPASSIRTRASYPPATCERADGWSLRSKKKRGLSSLLATGWKKTATVAVFAPRATRARGKKGPTVGAGSWYGGSPSGPGLAQSMPKTNPSQPLPDKSVAAGRTRCPGGRTRCGARDRMRGLLPTRECNLTGSSRWRKLVLRRVSRCALVHCRRDGATRLRPQDVGQARREYPANAVWRRKLNGA